MAQFCAIQLLLPVMALSHQNAESRRGGWRHNNVAPATCTVNVADLRQKDKR
jgi:hypothetical protein